MVVPLILGALAVAGAGAVAGVGANKLLGGSDSNPNVITNESPFRNYSPTYSPTNVTTDSRSFSDARVLNYSPSLIIESPNSTITKKEAISSQAQAESTPTVTTTPTVTGSTNDEQRGTSSGLSINPIYLLAGALIVGGVYYLAKRK